MAFCSSFSRPSPLKAASTRRSFTTFVAVPPSVKSHLRTVQKSRKRIPSRTQSKDSSAPDVDAIIKDLTDKWEKVENKSSIALYGVGVIAVLYVTSSIVGAVNSIPLLPKLLELIGFIYTAWFVYRYLLFKSSREELSRDVEELKAKIAGQSDDS